MKDGIQVPSEFVKARRRAANRLWMIHTVETCLILGTVCVLWNLLTGACERSPEFSTGCQCVGIVFFIAVGVIAFVKLLLSIPIR